MKLIRLVTCFTLLALPVLPAQAAQRIWKVNRVGAWEVGTNWENNISAANENDDAFLDSGTATVDAFFSNGTPPTARTVGSLRLEGNATVNVVTDFTTSGRTTATGLTGGNWNLVFANGAEITGVGSTTHTGPAWLQDGSFTGTGAGSTTLFSGNVTIATTNGNSLTFAREGGVTTTGTTTWTAGAGQGNVIVTSSWENQGTFNRNQNNNNGQLQLNGTGSFTNAANGIINVSGNNDWAVTGGGVFDNSGTINVDGTQFDVSAVAFNALANSSVNLSNGGEFIGSTTFDSATLGGSGTVTGDVTVSNGGTVSPGNSPGTLTVTGNLTVDASTVTIELGGTGAGEFDVLNVTNTLAFQNGAGVALQFFAPYDLGTATAGDTFDIITAGTLTGLTGANFDFSAVGGAGLWNTTITGTGASVTFVPEPGSLAFLGLGVMGVAFRRRRS